MGHAPLVLLLAMSVSAELEALLPAAVSVVADSSRSRWVARGEEEVLVVVDQILLYLVALFLQLQ
jgi:hypothetical protein